MLDTFGFTGCIQVVPALNSAEIEFLSALARSGRTLRSTPTGRGNDAVPFARLAWEACADGCSLRWDGSESSQWMLPSLEFLVDHLLRPGAVAEGHPRFEEFGFDHVLDGAVVGRAHDDATPMIVQVSGNLTSGCRVPLPCEEGRADPALPASSRRPANVIELRPRRA